MQIIKIQCQLISPMFMAGVDVKQPELRTSSIKGLMRYWWRALHSNLSTHELHELEIKIFGGIGDNDRGQKSPFTMRVEHNMKYGSHQLVPHKQGMFFNAFNPGEEFTVIFQVNDNYAFFPGLNTPDSIDRLIALFCISCTLGGFGRRARRGMGSVKPISKSINNAGVESFPSLNLNLLNEWINLFNQDYKIVSDSKGSAHIKLSKTNNNNYPYAKEIWISQQSRNDLLRYMSGQTHEVKKINPEIYKYTVGAASPRLSSPVFISLVDKGQSIVTMMHLPKNTQTDLQNMLRDRVL
jgi:CRISPR-associated protein Cmr1